MQFMSGGGIPPEILQQMMAGGMMGGMPMQRGPRRGRDVGVKMGVPLEMLYNGAKKEVEVFEKTLKVNIEPGMKHNEQIKFQGQAPKGPGIDIPGSIIVVLEQEEHDEYDRKGDDLFIKKTITLVQALTGFTIAHEHMDGRVLHIKSEKGCIIKPGDKKVVPGEGMKKRGERGKGDLIITFEIEFPRLLDEDQITDARMGLPKTQRTEVDFGKDEEPEECFLDHYSREEWIQMNRADEDDDDDDEGQGGGGIQCAHQ